MASAKSRKAAPGRVAPKTANPEPKVSLSAPPPVAQSFYHDLVWNLRNGVLAVTESGQIAVMNDVAYRIFGLTPGESDIGRPYSEVLKDLPDVMRIIASAFELSHLPNRAELRVKRTNKVIGYTLSQVRDPRERITGATLFFKDLTRVEQLEERERLRDRLAGTLSGGFRARPQHVPVRSRCAGRQARRDRSTARDPQLLVHDHSLG